MNAWSFVRKDGTMEQCIALVTPWLLGVGSFLGITMGIGLIYLKKHNH